MAAKKLRFFQTVSNEYREVCPELSRIMMMKCFEHLNRQNIEDFDENFQSNLCACERCGAIFTDDNCTYRIKPKRKRRSKNKRNARTFDIPKSFNFLQIHCHYCGWRTRKTGARRKIKDKLKMVSSKSDVLPQTQKQSINTCFNSPEQTVTTISRSTSRNSTGNKKKTKSRLKELLAKEKLESDQRIASPNLINFLASI